MLLLHALVTAMTAEVEAPVKFHCDGAVIIGLRSEDCGSGFGRAVEATVGPRVAGRPTIKVTYEPSWGTGFITEAITLLERDGQNYRLLWGRLLRQGEQVGSDQWQEITYKWSLDETGQRITVSGKRVLSNLGTDEVIGLPEALPTEQYCYLVDKRRFERCTS